jgi:hypothetical protein
MIMLDAIATTPYANEIITRSDHVPSDLERYGNWAQKFYGGGYHQTYKDSRESIDYVLGMPLNIAALAH